MFGARFDEKEKLWSSDQSPSVFNPNASLGQLMLYALQAHATRVAQVNTLYLFSLCCLYSLIKYIRL